MSWRGQFDGLDWSLNQKSTVLETEVRVRTKLAIGVVLLLVTILVYVALAAQRFPEIHARSCLVTITDLADRTIQERIPHGRYSEAIDAAEYIRWYYPAGSVLPEDHPFAEEYEAERKRQIDRIRSALENAVGDDPSIWEDWTQSIEGQ